MSDTVGVFGLSLLLAAYVRSQRCDDRVVVDWMMLVGAVLLAAYAWELRAWAFVALEVLWASVALRAIVGRLP